MMDLLKNLTTWASKIRAEKNDRASCYIDLPLELIQTHNKKNIIKV